MASLQSDVAVSEGVFKEGVDMITLISFIGERHHLAIRILEMFYAIQ